jgi:hypothetical protein
LYGEERGLKAPPLNIFAPLAFTERAVSKSCFQLSTAHGPAMITISGLPKRISPTFTMVSTDGILPLPLNEFRDPVNSGILHGFVSIVFLPID